MLTPDALLIACAVLAAPLLQTFATHVVVARDLRRQKRLAEREIDAQLAHARAELLSAFHERLDADDDLRGSKPS